MHRSSLSVTNVRAMAAVGVVGARVYTRGMRPRRVRRRRFGFTLIELMIVIAIIGVLAAIAVPNFRKIRARAQRKSCYANLRTIHGAVEWYSADENINYSVSDDAGFDVLVQLGYLQARPDCPEAGSYTAAGGADQAVCSVHGTIAQ